MAGRTVASCCAILILWLVTRPYLGVVQDARFYVLEGLHALDPARFAHDLYFEFGSQGSFSLSARLYKPLLAVLGVGATGIVLTAAGQILWLTGLWRLVYVLGRPYQWLSMAVVVGMLNIYAPYFGYGEAFATPRLFAEGLTMLALSWLTSRALVSLALLALAAAIHPLMALPGIVVALVYLALGQPIWWGIVAAGGGLAALLGLAGHEPFANLYRTVDPAWLAVIKQRSIQCLPSAWPPNALLQILGVVAWVIASIVLADKPHHRRFLIAVLVVGLSGVLCAFLGGDLFHNLLVLELQPWRSLWLLQIVARIYMPVVLAGIVTRTSFDRFRTTVLLTAGMILTLLAVRLMRFPNSAEFTPVSFALAVCALLLLCAQLLLAGQRCRYTISISIVLGFGLLFVALSRWDARQVWTRFLESSAPAPADLTALLPPKASVYWEDNIDMLWLKLKRPGYFSCDQGTGVVFYRDTAMAYRHRTNSFWPLRTADFTQSAACASFSHSKQPERNRSGLRKLCRREPHLDYVVLTSALPDMPAREWKSPVRFEDVHMSDGIYSEIVTDRFYIYSCSDIR